ncbi:uncharacterized protein LOC121836459 [Ixodes scapularis]|uniref:uncharacterized protein LOC121836459 n=1 Tax=Ixodes scapularis TaxID=6945 RepID=UPI001C38F21E|nr:uncharacterized protein LOC121836459 [Ixodes scapularis]
MTFIHETSSSLLAIMKVLESEKTLMHEVYSLLKVKLAALLKRWNSMPTESYGSVDLLLNMTEEALRLKLVDSFSAYYQMIQKSTQDEVSATPIYNYYKLLVDPHFLIDVGSIMLSWIIMGFNEPTMEPYLAEFHMNSAQIGVVFMVQYASYTVGSICSAVFCTYKMEAGFGLIGHILAILAYILLGPAPFIPCEPTLWMAYIAQVFIGIGTAAQFACHYCHAIKVAM